jgi:hypothetical protein
MRLRLPGLEPMPPAPGPTAADGAAINGADEQPAPAPLAGGGRWT